MRDNLVRLGVDLYLGDIDRLTDEKWDCRAISLKGTNAVHTTEHSSGMQCRRLLASPWSRPPGAVSWRGRPSFAESPLDGTRFCVNEAISILLVTWQTREKKKGCLSFHAPTAVLGLGFWVHKVDTQARIPAPSTSAPKDKGWGEGWFVQPQTTRKQEAEEDSVAPH